MEDEDVECEEADKDEDGSVNLQSKENGENGSIDKVIDVDNNSSDDDDELSLSKRVNFVAVPFEVVKCWFEMIFVVVWEEVEEKGEEAT